MKLKLRKQKGGGYGLSSARTRKERIADWLEDNHEEILTAVCLWAVLVIGWILLIVLI